MEKTMDWEETGGKMLTLYIAGLDCADCAAKLEKQVAALEGVITAKLSFGAGKMLVRHHIQEEEIVAVVERLGYQVRTGGRADLPGGGWRQRTSFVFTVVSGLLLAAAMLLEWAGWEENILLYGAAIVFGGFRQVKTSLYMLKKLALDMNILMTLAVLGACFLGEWSEGAAVVFLFSLGNELQGYTTDKARRAISSMLDLAPREATVVRDGVEMRLLAADMQVNDILLVAPGSRIAMDGVVCSGFSSVNQSAITGESIPVEKAVGDTVYAGTLNMQGALEVVVTKRAEDSTLSKIMHLVEDAQDNKARLERYVDRFARSYTPIVIGGAVLTMLIPWLFFAQPLSQWFYKGLLLLVISCPCALVISIPVSVISAMVNASRQGVLIKGGAYLEKIAEITVAAFDKTGTLTVGKPVVSDIIPFGAHREMDVLAVAAAVEKRSGHPLAQAVVAKAAELALPSAVDFGEIPGKGAFAVVDGQKWYVGNDKLFAAMDGATEAAEAVAHALRQQGKAIFWVGTEQERYGVIALADVLRENGKVALAGLRSAGIRRCALLTGDHAAAAAKIAAAVAIDDVRSELLPDGKAEAIDELRRLHGPVMMIGDGVNDAPALAAADIGVAMGVAGSDTALETADIALMTDDVGKIPYIVKLSRRMRGIIWQNIVFALLMKGIFILGTFTGFTNLWLAVLADTGAAVLVTLNSMRLLQNRDS